MNGCWSWMPRRGSAPPTCPTTSATSQSKLIHSSSELWYLSLSLSLSLWVYKNDFIPFPCQLCTYVYSCLHSDLDFENLYRTPPPHMDLYQEELDQVQDSFKGTDQLLARNEAQWKRQFYRAVFSNLTYFLNNRNLWVQSYVILDDLMEQQVVKNIRGGSGT